MKNSSGDIEDLLDSNHRDTLKKGFNLMRGFGANLHSYVKLNTKEVSSISDYVNNFLVLKNYEGG